METEYKIGRWCRYWAIWKYEYRYWMFNPLDIVLTREEALKRVKELEEA